mgnify:CR=1 FL=1
MELEELQKAWKELNERVSQNELVHQQQISLKTHCFILLF